MHRSIGAIAHGIIDYALVIFLILGPSLAGFRGRQATICYVLAALHLALTLITRFPLGAVKALRLSLHGAIELIVGLLMIVLPWLASFSAGIRSRNFFVAIGLLVVVIWYLTDYRGLRAAGRATPPASAAR